MRDFAAAEQFYRETLAVDPENLSAHYNLMLAYQGLGDRERARRHQTFYRRFKADESAQAIAGAARRAAPELNLERQAIREHYNMPPTNGRNGENAPKTKQNSGGAETTEDEP